MNPHAEHDTIGNRLRYALDQRGMSGRGLAREAGVTASLVGQYMRGELSNPKLDTLRAFAAALQASLRWLMTGIGDMEDPTDIPPRQVRRTRTYGDLAGWSEMEPAALKLVPHLESALVAVRKAEVDEEPQMLTATWVAYRAERFSREMPGGRGGPRRAGAGRRR